MTAAVPATENCTNLTLYYHVFGCQLTIASYIAIISLDHTTMYSQLSADEQSFHHYYHGYNLPGSCPPEAYWPGCAQQYDCDHDTCLAVGLVNFKYSFMCPYITISVSITHGS